MQASDEGLPFNICHGTTWTDSWRVTAVPESDIISVKLMLGVLQLEGKGTRKGLRCSTISGSVLEGRHDPCCVGSFRLGLVLPSSDSSSLKSLQDRHQARLNARKAPPLTFSRSGLASLVLAGADMGPSMHASQDGHVCSGCTAGCAHAIASDARVRARLIATACMWLYGRAVTRCDGHGHVGQAHHSDD